MLGRKNTFSWILIMPALQLRWFPSSGLGTPAFVAPASFAETWMQAQFPFCRTVAPHDPPNRMVFPLRATRHFRVRSTGGLKWSAGSAAEHGHEPIRPTGAGFPRRTLGTSEIIRIHISRIGGTVGTVRLYPAPLPHPTSFTCFTFHHHKRFQPPSLNGGVVP